MQNLSDAAILDSSKIYECLSIGNISMLSDVELLYTITDNQDAAEQLAEVGKNKAFNLYNKLISIRGIGKKTAAKICAMHEYARRSKFEKVEHIRTSRDVFELLAPAMGRLPHEEFFVIYLSRANKILAKQKIGQGGVGEVYVDNRIILKQAVEVLASGVILCHNHPSGGARPSEADDKVTKVIKETLQLLDISLLDHVIIADDQKYYSYADHEKIQLL